MGSIGQATGQINEVVYRIGRGVRAPFLSVSLIPALMGGAAAWMNGAFHPGRFLLAVLAVLLLHAAANLWNDYHDELSGSDRMQTNPSPYSGGSRVIQDGLWSVGQVKGAALAFFILGGVCGIGANLGGSIASLVCLAAGIGIGLGYSAPPLRWVSRGWGELSVGLAFGPLLAGGVYLTQAPHMPVGLWIASTAFGLLVAVILCINEIPDRSPDRATNKYTWAVRISENGFRRWIVLLIGLAYLLVIAGGVLGILPRLTLIVLITLPLALKVGSRLPQVAHGDVTANRLMIQLTSVFGLILFVAFIAGRWIG